VTREGCDTTKPGALVTRDTGLKGQWLTIAIFAVTAILAAGAYVKQAQYIEAELCNKADKEAVDTHVQYLSRELSTHMLFLSEQLQEIKLDVRALRDKDK